MGRGRVWGGERIRGLVGGRKKRVEGERVWEGGGRGRGGEGGVGGGGGRRGGEGGEEGVELGEEVVEVWAAGDPQAGAVAADDLGAEAFEGGQGLCGGLGEAREGFGAEGGPVLGEARVGEAEEEGLEVGDEGAACRVQGGEQGVSIGAAAREAVGEGLEVGGRIHQAPLEALHVVDLSEEAAGAQADPIPLVRPGVRDGAAPVLLRQLGAAPQAVEVGVDEVADPGQVVWPPARSQDEPRHPRNRRPPLGRIGPRPRHRERSATPRRNGPPGSAHRQHLAPKRLHHLGRRQDASVARDDAGADEEIGQQREEILEIFGDSVDLEGEAEVRAGHRPKPTHPHRNPRDRPSFGVEGVVEGVGEIVGEGGRCVLGQCERGLGGDGTDRGGIVRRRIAVHPPRNRRRKTRASFVREGRDLVGGGTHDVHHRLPPGEPPPLDQRRPRPVGSFELRLDPGELGLEHQRSRGPGLGQIGEVIEPGMVRPAGAELRRTAHPGAQAAAPLLRAIADHGGQTVVVVVGGDLGEGGRDVIADPADVVVGQLVRGHAADRDVHGEPLAAIEPGADARDAQVATAGLPIDEGSVQQAVGSARDR